MQNKASAIFPLTLISAALLNITPVYAQDNIGLEEVVVTAQRREQNLQDVPVSVTAFTGATLELRNIKNAVEYLTITPGVPEPDPRNLDDIEVPRSVRGLLEDS